MKLRLYSLSCVSYIKEFVHGDFGRTTPNLSSLTGVECDILELDVEVGYCYYLAKHRKFQIKKFSNAILNIPTILFMLIYHHAWLPLFH